MEKENENYAEEMQERSDELREGMAEEEARDEVRERENVRNFTPFSPSREKVTESMNDGEKKSANLLMNLMDSRAMELGSQWGRSIRKLL